MCVIDNAPHKNRKSSNGWKIAGMARILMKFGPNESHHPSCFMKSFPTHETNEKFPKDSKNYRKQFEKILKIDIADVINY